MKKKLQIGITTIILTTSVSYLIQYWFKHSGLEDKTLNKLDDIKDIFNGGKQMNWIAKIRPQIFLAIIILGTISLYALRVGHVEVATATIGGLIALGMKVLEAD